MVPTPLPSEPPIFLLNTHCCLQILTFLPPSSLLTLSSTCNRCLHVILNEEELWEELYYAKYSITPDLPYLPQPLRTTTTTTTPTLPPSPFYKKCYISALASNQTLWITHWNITLPSDHDSTGRVCIPSRSHSGPPPSPSNSPPDPPDLPPAPHNPLAIPHSLASLQNLCPTCRYHPMLPYGTHHIHANLAAESAFAKTGQDNCSFATHDPVAIAEHTSIAHAVGLGLPSHTAPLLPPPSSSTHGIYHSLNYSAAKAARFMRAKYFADLAHPQTEPTLSFYNNIATNVPTSARRAFSQTGTYNRDPLSEGGPQSNRLGASTQYNSAGLNFAKDLIFLLAQPPALNDRVSQSLLDQLIDPNIRDTFRRHHINLTPGRKGSVSHLGPKAEKGAHCMHTLRFSNPSHTNPITWRILTSRSDCFAVHPAEGTLSPGQTVHVYFTVRALGSYLSLCLENATTQRVAREQFMVDMMKNQGPLPEQPYMIQYIVCPMLPCLPPGYSPTHSKFTVTEYLWQRAKPYEIKTVKLAAHVNASYSLEALEKEALMPFEIKPTPEFLNPSRGAHTHAAGNKPNTFNAPNLETRRIHNNHFRDHPKFKVLNGMHQEPYTASGTVPGHTEPPCLVCGATWGLRAEQLGRNFQLKKIYHEALYHLEKSEMDMLKPNLEAIMEQVSEIAEKGKEWRELTIARENEEIEINDREYRDIYDVQLRALAQECFGKTMALPSDASTPQQAEKEEAELSERIDEVVNHFNELHKKKQDEEIKKLNYSVNPKMQDAGSDSLQKPPTMTAEDLLTFSTEIRMNPIATMLHEGLESIERHHWNDVRLARGRRVLRHGLYDSAEVDALIKAWQTVVKLYCLNYTRRCEGQLTLEQRNRWRAHMKLCWKAMDEICDVMKTGVFAANTKRWRTDFERGCRAWATLTKEQQAQLYAEFPGSENDAPYNLIGIIDPCNVPRNGNISPLYQHVRSTDVIMKTVPFKPFLCVAYSRVEKMNEKEWGAEPQEFHLGRVINRREVHTTYLKAEKESWHKCMFKVGFWEFDTVGEGPVVNNRFGLYSFMSTLMTPESLREEVYREFEKNEIGVVNVTVFPPPVFSRQRFLATDDHESMGQRGEVHDVRVVREKVEELLRDRLGLGAEYRFSIKKGGSEPVLTKMVPRAVGDLDYEGFQSMHWAIMFDEMYQDCLNRLGGESISFWRILEQLYPDFQEPIFKLPGPPLGAAGNSWDGVGTHFDIDVVAQRRLGLMELQTFRDTSGAMFLIMALFREFGLPYPEEMGVVCERQLLVNLNSFGLLAGCLSVVVGLAMRGFGLMDAEPREYYIQEQAEWEGSVYLDCEACIRFTAPLLLLWWVMGNRAGALLGLRKRPLFWYMFGYHVEDWDEELAEEAGEALVYDGPLFARRRRGGGRERRGVEGGEALGAADRLSRVEQAQMKLNDGEEMGSVGFVDRGDLDVAFKVLMFLGTTWLGFATAGPNFFTNLTLCGFMSMGLAACVTAEKFQTGQLPANYSVLLLAHTGSSVTFVLSLLFGVIVGASGGRGFVAELSLLIVGPAVGMVGAGFGASGWSWFCMLLLSSASLVVYVGTRVAMDKGLRTMYYTYVGWLVFFVGLAAVSYGVVVTVLRAKFFHPLNSFVRDGVHVLDGSVDGNSELYLGV